MKIEASIGRARRRTRVMGALSRGLPRRRGSGRRQ
jgi:hypothetical protein